MTDTPQTTNLPSIPDLSVGKLSMKPGDVLVVRTDRRVTMETAQAIRRHMSAHLPAGTNCVVLGPEIDLSVITQQDERAPAIFKALKAQQ